MRWYKFPVAAFSCQEVLVVRQVGWWVKHLVQLMKLVWHSLKIGPIIKINGSGLSSRDNESSQGSKECLCGQFCNYFQMNSLCTEADKYGRCIPWWLIYCVLVRVVGIQVRHSLFQSLEMVLVELVWRAVLPLIVEKLEPWICSKLNSDG
jgi:hypothetical protein